LLTNIQGNISRPRFQITDCHLVLIGNVKKNCQSNIRIFLQYSRYLMNRKFKNRDYQHFHQNLKSMLCLCFVFLHLVRPVLLVSLDCSILAAPSVFSRLSYFSCPFGVLWRLFSTKINNSLSPQNHCTQN